MKKFYFLAMVIMIVLGNSGLLAQYDARELPEVLSIKYYNEPPLSIHPKGNIYWPTGKIPPNIIKKYKKPITLDESGIKLVPITSSGHQSETWIAVDPNNTNNLVSGANDYRYNYSGAGYRMGAYYSADGGQNWVERTTPANLDVYISQPSGGGNTNFDPGIAIDDKGMFYYSYGFAQTLSTGGQADNGVFVVRSSDGGKSWDGPYPVAVNYGSNSAFNDRYMIAADSKSDNPDLRGNVYIAWIIFGSNSNAVYVSTSKDQGISWSNARRLPGNTYAVQAPTPVIGKHGELYVAYSNAIGQKTYGALQKSTDGGSTWLSNPIQPLAVDIMGTRDSQSGRQVLTYKDNMRISSYPAIAVDNSDGIYSNSIYMIQAGKIDGVSGLYMVRSTDGGKTWKDQKRIDDNALNNDVFLPSASVDPTNGILSVLYYSSQNDPNNIKVDAYIAISDDGGETFSHVRLSPASFIVKANFQGPGNRYWGDYSGITSFDGNIYPCFWMPNNSFGNFYSVTLYTALLSPKPQAPDNLSYSISASAPDIILNWNDPKLNNLGLQMSNFDIVVYRDGKKIATVLKGVQQYTDKNVVDGQAYTYILRARIGSLLSDPVSVYVISGGNKIPKVPTEISSRPGNNSVILYWKNPSEHIDGTEFYDFSEIRVYDDNDKLIKTIKADNSSIMAGEYASAVIDGLENQKFYVFRLKAVSERNGVKTESEYSEDAITYAGVPYEALSMDFEDNTMMPHYTNSDWGIVDAKGSKALTDSPEGNYLNNFNSQIIFAPVVIHSDNTSLTMKQIAFIYQSEDWAYIDISTDLKNWKQLFAFNSDLSSLWTDQLETSNWYTRTFSLADYVNDTIYIKLGISANILINRDGWYIDEMKIDNSPVSVNEVPFLTSVKMNIYPNPAESYSELDIFSPMNMAAGIAVYDQLGNLVLNMGNRTIEQGDNRFELNLTGLAQGMYYCRVTSEGYTRTIPVIINR